MPQYEYKCQECGWEEHRIQPVNADYPECCGRTMDKKITCPALVKMKGEGGFPARRKWIQDWTPESKPFGSIGSLHGQRY